ncbi:hypothetical protein LTR08_001651 [Meristemomyces frigidus]|nr:hypothetical protein LTR08_001651 [Meristemomyces frigidus]
MSTTHNTTTSEPGRNTDGTFKKGSEADKGAENRGGLHSHDNDGLAKEESVSELEAIEEEDPGFGREVDMCQLDESASYGTHDCSL